MLRRRRKVILHSLVARSMPALLALQSALSVVLIALLVAIGLFFVHRIGLGAPILERWLKGEAVGTRSKYAADFLLDGRLS